MKTQWQSNCLAGRIDFSVNLSTLGKQLAQVSKSLRLGRSLKEYPYVPAIVLLGCRGLSKGSKAGNLSKLKYASECFRTPAVDIEGYCARSPIGVDKRSGNGDV